VVSGRLDQVLGDERSRQRRNQRVAVHVEGVGLKCREAVRVGELVAGVDDDRFDRATGQGALADRVQVLTSLSDVDGDGDDLSVGLLGHQPMATEVSSPPE
jgi:hypothetical protein